MSDIVRASRKMNTSDVCPRVSSTKILKEFRLKQATSLPRKIMPTAIPHTSSKHYAKLNIAPVAQHFLSFLIC